jgi:AAA domain-containing protein
MTDREPRFPDTYRATLERVLLKYPPRTAQERGSDAVLLGHGAPAPPSPNGPAPTAAAVHLPPVLRLADLLADPALLAPPAALLPRLAWAGRVTLLASAEKLGKSTLAGQAAAALVTGGRFLGEAVATSPVLWFALDEPLGDLVRRLAAYGARDEVFVCQQPATADQLEQLIRTTAAQLVVVDTLLEYFAGTVQDPNQAAHWLAPLKALRDVPGDALPEDDDAIPF